MISRLRLAITLFPLLLVCSLPLFAQTPPKEGTATVAGRVTLKGEPVRGAMVALSPDSRLTRFELKNVLRAKTDDAGRFRIEKIKAGLYYLGAIVPGYVSPGENRYGAQGKAINIAEGETVENYEIPLKPGGVITGRLTDANGNPLVAQGVDLARLNDQGKPERIFLGPNGSLFGTDDRGIYRIYGLAAGRYLVSTGFEQRPSSITVTMNRTFYPRTYHPDATSEARAKIVEVSEGRETTGVDITVGALKKNFDVAGRVIYADTSQPAAAVEVHYGSIDERTKRVGAWASTGEQTNSEGEFRLQNILPGKYGAFAGTWKLKDGSYSETVLFEIDDADATGIEIKLRRGSSIGGVAVLEGVSDPAILGKISQLKLSFSVTSQQDFAAPNQSSPVTIAPNGTFQLTGIQPGKVRIGLFSDSMSAGDPSRSFSLLRVEHSGAIQNDGIDVGAGEQITNVRLILGYGNGVVRGQVKVAGGTLPDTLRILVSARRTDSGVNLRAGEIDPRGQFRIENLPPGEYEVFLSIGYRTQEPPPGFDELQKLVANVKQRVTLTDNAETQVTLTLDLSRKEGN
ncbi:MAG TPA: carboxypeptidase-like regulatory domain-containing protein [Blastocatellia bacterium]|nr:carboxypeptidase-like regulatory domain-containing protein [Blastocatellia bacterium]